MNDGLLDAFRHNAWATGELIARCRDLSPDQLATAATGTFGAILDTLDHTVSSDGGYLRSLTGHAPRWAVEEQAARDLDELEARAAETATAWERFLSAPIDGERLLVLDQGTYEARAGVVVAQVLHHGNAHREQVCAILTSLGIEPPDLQPWAYADATGRGGPRAE